MQNIDGNKENTKGRRFPLYLLCLILAVAAAAGLITSYCLRKDLQAQEKSSGIVIEANASEWNPELPDLSGAQSSGIKIPGYGDITVPADTNTWKITLANPQDNNCYFKYSITLDGSEDPVYESDYIEPGKAVTQFDVSDTPEAGDHEIHMNISTYSMDENHTRLNGASVKADLHIVK